MEHFTVKPEQSVFQQAIHLKDITVVLTDVWSFNFMRRCAAREISNFDSVLQCSWTMEA